MNFYRRERKRRWLGHLPTRVPPFSLLPSMPSVRFGRGRLPAFTLIELLVVIAIIAILAALLLPALRKAKRSGQSIGCCNNQKQLQLAWQMYHEEHNDHRGSTRTAFGKRRRHLSSTPWIARTCAGCSAECRAPGSGASLRWPERTGLGMIRGSGDSLPVISLTPL